MRSTKKTSLSLWKIIYVVNRKPTKSAFLSRLISSSVSSDSIIRSAELRSSASLTSGFTVTGSSVYDPCLPANFVRIRLKAESIFSSFEAEAESPATEPEALKSESEILERRICQLMDIHTNLCACVAYRLPADIDAVFAVILCAQKIKTCLSASVQCVAYAVADKPKHG